MGREMMPTEGEVKMKDSITAKTTQLCKSIENAISQGNTFAYDEMEKKLTDGGFQLDEYGGGNYGPAYAVFVHPCGIVVNVEYTFKRNHQTRDSWRADSITRFNWENDPEYQRWST